MMSGAVPILCLAIRASGPNAFQHSILEIGARFYSGPRAGDEFEATCSLWPGARWDPRTAPFTGLSPESFVESAYSDTEAEAVDALCRWISEPEVVLAGFRPGPVRAFVAAAWGRAHPPRCGASREPFRRISARFLDLHSIFTASRLRRGDGASSYTHDEICAAHGLASVSLRDPSLHVARRESEILTALLKP